MKIIKKKMNSANAGFSLVEVLLAVCILALVAVPILRTITVSMKMNLQSKELLAATDTTQSMMEYIRSYPMEDYSDIAKKDITTGIAPKAAGVKSRLAKSDAGGYSTTGVSDTGLSAIPGVSLTALPKIATTASSFSGFKSNLAATTTVSGNMISYAINGEETYVCIWNAGVESKRACDLLISFTPQKVSTSDKYFVYNVHIESYKAHTQFQEFYSELDGSIVNNY